MCFIYNATQQSEMFRGKTKNSLLRLCQPPAPNHTKSNQISPNLTKSSYPPGFLLCPQGCYGAALDVTARCYGVDHDNHQCLPALLRCYGAQTGRGAMASSAANRLKIRSYPNLSEPTRTYPNLKIFLPTSAWFSRRQTVRP